MMAALKSLLDNSIYITLLLVYIDCLFQVGDFPGS